MTIPCEQHYWLMTRTYEDSEHGLMIEEQCAKCGTLKSVPGPKKSVDKDGLRKWVETNMDRHNTQKEPAAANVLSKLLYKIDRGDFDRQD
ncbi:hypothetical protein [Planococcus lenghuensis]|uniref:Uncharacterized protein n=1 Tax=Planococcus lenghuensis TaxID=2213202 RepID=A0A1Q2L512_9BACL|nr:hypothetical protein [Planococcus lenghuensis]AQQ55491.1 hypothetical protein B0X71_20290 [Planococcus lenghuensis]